MELRQRRGGCTYDRAANGSVLLVDMALWCCVVWHPLVRRGILWVVMGGRRGVGCYPADSNHPSIVAPAGSEGRSLPTSKGALLFGSIWSISMMNAEETGAI